jgi:hypothetical protein
MPFVFALVSAVAVTSLVGAWTMGFLAALASGVSVVLTFVDAWTAPVLVAWGDFVAAPLPRLHAMETTITKIARQATVRKMGCFMLSSYKVPA